MDPEIRDMIIRTDTTVQGINARLKKHDEIHEDLENRIRTGEKFRAWFIGVFTTGATGTSLLAGLKHFISGGPG